MTVWVGEILSTSVSQQRKQMRSLAPPPWPVHYRRSRPVTPPHRDHTSGHWPRFRSALPPGLPRATPDGSFAKCPLGRISGWFAERRNLVHQRGDYTCTMRFQCILSYRTPRSNGVSVWRTSIRGKDPVSVTAKLLAELMRRQRRPVTFVGMYLHVKEPKK